MYISRDDVAQYERDGYFLAKNLFTKEEVEKMLAAVESGGKVKDTAYGVNDQTGKAARLAIWFDLTDDIWSAASTCPRIINNVRILLGEEVSFFHGKVMLKEAHSGGAWEWHQDYGYWYDQGFLFPNMISAFIALDPCTIENGCLRVLRGSHKMGRLEHQVVGTQTGANPDRLKAIEGRFEQVACEMEPGSVLFFHSNLLHTSSANDSDHHRRAFIMCYSAWPNPQVWNGIVTERPVCPVGPDDAILKF